MRYNQVHAATPAVAACTPKWVAGMRVRAGGRALGCLAGGRGLERVR